MMASSGPIMLAVLRLRGKTKFWMWERNVTWNNVMQGTHHLKTRLARLADDVTSGFGALVVAVSGCERPGSRCCVAIDKTRRRWAISSCVCVANHILNYIISPSYFRISSIDVLAMGSRRWMICNTCFGCCTAIDVGGRHGRSIWIFVRRAQERESRESERERARDEREWMRRVITVTNGDEIQIFS